MSSFEKDADRVLALLGEGLSQLEACDRAGVSIHTFRKWVANGRRNPNSMYGQFVAKMETAGEIEQPNVATSRQTGDAAGPLESEVKALLEGRDLKGDLKLVAAEALTLARSADRLGATKGGNAAIALTQVSRRLEELIERLAVAKEDHIDELKAEIAEARARAAAGTNGGSF